MQENEVKRKRNTNLKVSSFTSIVWVLELIDRTLVYGVFLLQVESEHRMKFSRKKTVQDKQIIKKTAQREKSVNKVQ